MAKDDKKVEEVPREREGTRPDFSIPPARKKLPKDIQDTLDSEEKMWETMYEGKSEDSTDSNVRYAAYASRVRTIMLSAQRYVAYTSDIGESFRPVAHPYLVKGAYAVSWLYLTGDVAHEGYKAYLRNQRVLHPEEYQESDATPTAIATGIQGAINNVKERVKNSVGMNAGGVVKDGLVVPGHVPAIEDYRAVMAQRAVFQSIASMGLPAFTIHSIVRYSGRALKDAKNKTVRTWGPIGLGLAFVPALPYLFDHPVEVATEWIFHNAFKLVGGPQAVEGRPVTGNKELRYIESHETANDKKEL
ncbi:hypothetical protein K504DRAFT_460286 [Pleomassaria siparia CBS 279.74]|uniref:Mitochondrial fission process protein 1 n=1 Tax=Pleomassaria siparia CBS 279.74 TaxID=1314801 RepID=A0A6G1JYZ1_9PLEO|nr:hypothetical protein K504DRAFT_460286 [Pleomassaria siparia CBS 279.74]